VRRILLWLAANGWLRRHVPRWWFARRAVRRFMPGETADEALAAAERFREDGVGTLFTHLGENVTNPAEAAAATEGYAALLEEIAARDLDAEISVKLTHLGLDLDPAAAERHLESLVERARGLGAGCVWIDMESSAYTDATVDLYARLRRGHDNIGLCLQAYLRRTPADIQRLIPLGSAIRLVKGAYDEPATIAFSSRSEVDANFLAQAVLLAVQGRDHGVRLGLGTHDVRLIEQVAAYCEAAGIGRDTFEVQMLYGIRVNEQLRMAREGYRVRDLIAYGPHWYAWYLRRLAERPANVAFVARQVLPW
jgi:proline dehydrogenase